MLNIKIEVKGSIIEGMGLFATEDIQQGELICWPDETYFSCTSLEKKQYPLAFRWGGNEYWQAADNSELMNHRCDPNCEVDMSVTHPQWIARRAIPAGQELTYDYGTTELGLWKRKCLCGSDKCRGKFTGMDYKILPDDIGVSPFILKCMRNQGKRLGDQHATST